ncbi:MAG: xanthine dehydrogenase family protein molybdopterin-binding subunit [Acidimicrobiia bacterium]|jgi:carbon-monoxide dehydrogenase large subunit
MATSGSILGNPVIRLEDPRILRGDTHYLDDLPFPGAAHVVFVRSTIAHARIESIDTTEAKAMPGVVDVYTSADLDVPDVQGFIMLPPAFNRPSLAKGRVRFVGDIVAAVVAETRAQAVDAAEAVIVDYDPLPVVVDPEAAMADDAPVLFEEHGSNVAFTMDFGDDPTVLEGADHVVSLRSVSQRLAAVPMEGNAIVAEPTAEGMTVHVPTQGPNSVRDSLAPLLGYEQHQLRVVAPAVGGGFGAKQGVYPEFVVVGHAAKKLNRPVKWVETRSENMVAMAQGRGQLEYLELGLTKEGRIVGMKGRVIGDAGAYPAIGAFLVFFTRQMAPGVYDIPKVDVKCFGVATNTTPMAAYRGAGRPEAAQFLERALDIAADELGIDPVEIRKRNFIPPDAFPVTTVTGSNYDSGNYVLPLDEACRIAGYDDLRAEQRARRERGDRTLIGIGVSTYVEITAPGIFSEYGKVEVTADGGVDVTVGTSSHGQGHRTAFAMIVQDLLGVPMEKVRLIQNDTDFVPRGSGTMGSRSIQIAGSAVHEASTQVLEKAKQLAAHLLEADVDDITVYEGVGLGVAGVPANALTWQELSLAATEADRRPPGWEGHLEVELDFNQGESTYPFGAHIAVVEIDRDTGRVELLRIIAVDDCGRIINPILVRGQQHGGIAQGVAQALYEQVVYDADGNPLTANLMDYAMPSAAEFPSFEASNTETPTTRNPLGAKGIGESATIGSTPAVQNAVIDALSHLGVIHLDMPFTAERVWQAIQGAQPTA